MLIVTKLAKYFPSMCSQNALGTCTIKNKNKKKIKKKGLPNIFDHI